MRKFDFYEFSGIFIPGVVLLFGVSRLVPRIWGPAIGGEFTLGEFGLFVVLAYITGHFVAVIAGLLEERFWDLKGGMPTDVILSGKQKLLGADQRAAVPGKMIELDIKAPADLTTMKKGERRAVTRAIYAVTRRAGLHARVDLFNAQYGMFRGLLVSLLLLLVVCATIEFNLLPGRNTPWQGWTLLALLTLCSYFGMVKNGQYYSRELFVQFLIIRRGDIAKPEKPEDDE